MRIATSTIYANQSLYIDNLSSEYETDGTELSTGLSLNVPSDDPGEIAEDLSVRNESAVTTQVSSNLTNLNNLLSTTDSSLSNLTSILQSARNLAVEGAQDTISTSQRSAIGQQVNQLLQQAIGLANTQYDGKFVFSGTKVPPGGSLVQAVGSPPTSVVTAQNIVQQNQELPDGQTVPTNVTLQQAFNVGASNGSPSIFNLLIRLRDTLENGSVVDESAQQVNVPDQSVLPTTTLGALTVTNPPVLSTPLTTEGAPGNNISFAIASSLSPNGTQFIFTTGSTVQSVIAGINADTSLTGVTANFDYQTQRLSLTDVGNGPFQINNVVSGPGVAAPANFTSAFLISSTPDVVTNLSTQLGDIDNALTVTLSAAGQVGATVQTVAALSSAESSQGTQDTQLQSNLEDTDIAKVTSQFTLAQTALQAAYSTTTRLEQENLFSYLGQ
jgi:flagellar hook-associated protein 3 FlgL